MRGTPVLFLAQLNIPDARQCLVIAGPFLSLAALIWLIRNIDFFIEQFFPDWEWERNLGWLNIRAQKQAERVLRWLGYLVYAALAVALYGVIWAVQGLIELTATNGDIDMGEVGWRMSILVGALGFWVAYLGLELIPRLRDQCETEELKRFRAEQAELEKEREAEPRSRVKAPLKKPRWTKPTRSEWPKPRR